jgi:D-sedoheptulose 7-phosphate isomerase
MGNLIGMRDILQRSLDDGCHLLKSWSTDPNAISAMESISQALVTAFQSNRKVLSCGNGGSMADAMHFAEEFSGRFRKDRPPLPVIALCDATHLTCVANDFGFEFVFSRLIEALGHPGDVLIAISTSGNSPNMIRAVEKGIERGMVVVGLVGKGGGRMAEVCDMVLHAPGETSDRIQELHMIALHAMIEAVESKLGYL